MKMLFAMAALATLLTSPALAQYGVWPGPYGGYTYRAYAYPYQAFAQENYGFRRSLNGSFDVYDPRGRYVGSDPDPRIRSTLARDPPTTSD